MKFTPGAQKLVELLLGNNGRVRNFGGIVYGAPNSTPISISTLMDGIKELDKAGFKLRRCDAGGSPTWALED